MRRSATAYSGFRVSVRRVTHRHTASRSSGLGSTSSSSLRARGGGGGARPARPPPPRAGGAVVVDDRVAQHPVEPRDRALLAGRRQLVEAAGEGVLEDVLRHLATA